MKIAVVGGGITGLTAAYRLSLGGNEVILLESDRIVGGLAKSFKRRNWKVSLEKAYHHWFTNDSHVLNLCEELGVSIEKLNPESGILVNSKVYRFDTILSLLLLPILSFFEKIRLGIGLFYLKIVNEQNYFNKINALTWITKSLGKKSSKLIWDPLFSGKFNRYKNKVVLTWFWARIKKRTQKLYYPNKGFSRLSEVLSKKIRSNGCEIKTNSKVKKVISTKHGVKIFLNDGQIEKVDKVLLTVPSKVMFSMSLQLERKFRKKRHETKYLHAQTLILILKKPFLDKTYWLNITDKSFPFLVVVDHTNLINSANYGGERIAYIGNYLPDNHRYLKYNKKQILKEFDNFLKKINPDYKKNLRESYLFNFAYAQPVVDKSYGKDILPINPKINNNVFIANMDMVYPWDRGTNYAVELGEKVAIIIRKTT